MSRLDRAVVAVLAIVLVALGAALSLPRSAPPAAPTPAPSGGPGSTDAPPVTYREGIVGTPTSITPITARSRVERTLVGLIFSGLVRLGPGNTIEPDLAASWEVGPAGEIWTFHIRPDATWQDGSAVTADDVVFTINALKSGDASGVEAASWAEVTVEAIDTKTVRFTLGTPVAGFLAALTQPLLPQHLLAGQPLSALVESPFSRQPVGSGPFVLISLDQDVAVLVRATSGSVEPDASPQPSGSPLPGTVAPSPVAASPAASAGASATPRPSGSAGPSATAAPAPSEVPSIEPSLAPTPSPTSPPIGAAIQRVEIHFYQNASDLGDAFRAGALDAVVGLPQADIADLAALPGVDRLRYPTSTLTAVLLNLQPTQPQLRDPVVRRALLASIDRNALANSLLGGDATRADTLVPPTSWAFDAASAPQVAFDLSASSAALKKAGWTQPTAGWTAPKAKAPFTIQVLTVPPASSARLARIATYVRDAWTAAGFAVELVEVDASELSARLHEGDYTAAVVDIAMGVEPDLYSLLAATQVRATGANLSGYQDAALDVLLAAARTPATPDKRLAAWSALEKELAQALPILPLVWHDDVVVAKGVNGVDTRLIGGPGDRFWDVLSWRLAAAG